MQTQNQRRYLPACSEELFRHPFFTTGAQRILIHTNRKRMRNCCDFRPAHLLFSLGGSIHSFMGWEGEFCSRFRKMLLHKKSGIFFIVECYQSLIDLVPTAALKNGNFECCCTHAIESFQTICPYFNIRLRILNFLEKVCFIVRGEAFRFYQHIDHHSSK